MGCANLAHFVRIRAVNSGALCWMVANRDRAMTKQLPASHMAFIQTTLGRPLTVFLPTLYRHMEATYIEAFSKEGSIRLSCFATFARHKDEQRQDAQEGHALHVLNDLKNDRSIGFYTMTGTNAYVLSVTSRTGLQFVEAFGPDRMEILEPIGFCAEIANEIPGCQTAMISQCMYADDKVLQTLGTAPTIDDLKSDTEPDKTSLEKVMAQGNALGGPKQYFLKDRRYEAQSEYRFVWETNRPVKEPLNIVAPNLKKYCNL
jgi:hypothetical protein